MLARASQFGYYSVVCLSAIQDGIIKHQSMWHQSLKDTLHHTSQPSWIDTHVVLNASCQSCCQFVIVSKRTHYHHLPQFFSLEPTYLFADFFKSPPFHISNTRCKLLVTLHFHIRLLFLAVQLNYHTTMYSSFQTYLDVGIFSSRDNHHIML